jgi:hypothetical protein
MRHEKCIQCFLRNETIMKTYSTRICGLDVNINMAVGWNADWIHLAQNMNQFRATVDTARFLSS